MTDTTVLGKALDEAWRMWCDVYKVWAMSDIVVHPKNKDLIEQVAVNAAMNGFLLALIEGGGDEGEAAEYILAAWDRIVAMEGDTDV